MRGQDGPPEDVPRMECAEPWCSVCENDLEHDGESYRCEKCNVYWPPAAWDGDPATHDLETGERLWGTE